MSYDKLAMQPPTHFFRSSIVVLFWSGCTALYAQGQGVNVPLEISAQTAIVFMADQSSFTLSFTDFKRGARTNTVDVTYTVQANDVTRADDVVIARLDSLFPNIGFQGQFGSYVEKGGNATLTPSQSGFVTLGTSDVGLAKKSGGKMLDGTFIVTYQAEALEDQAAGEELRTLIVTFAPI